MIMMIATNKMTVSPHGPLALSVFSPYQGIANLKIVKSAKALAGGLLAGAQLLLHLVMQRPPVECWLVDVVGFLVEFVWFGLALHGQSA